MNLREALDNLSEQSSLGEHLLSSRERELLSSIWRHAKNHGGGAEVVERIEAVLASAVGQTVMQRASDAIGRSVLEEIREQFSSQADVEPTATRIVLNSPPPPATGPRPPAPAPGPGPGRNRVESYVSLATPDHHRRARDRARRRLLGQYLVAASAFRRSPNPRRSLCKIDPSIAGGVCGPG